MSCPRYYGCFNVVVSVSQFHSWTWLRYERISLNLSTGNVSLLLHQAFSGSGLLDSLPSTVVNTDICGSIQAVSWIWYRQISFVVLKTPNPPDGFPVCCPVCIRDRQSGRRRTSRHCVRLPVTCHRFVGRILWG